MTFLSVLPYSSSVLKLGNKEIDLDSDTLVATLHTASYTLDLDTHAYVSDLTNELTTASGYTAGGVTIGGKSLSLVVANSWTWTRANSTAYVVGDVRRPATGNGYIYRCAVAGTSGGSAPTWLTVVGGTTTDGGVTWTCMGRAAIRLDFNDVVWAEPFSAGPFRYMVLSDRTPGTAATQPLIAVGDWGADQTGLGGAFTVQVDAAGALVGFIMAA